MLRKLSTKILPVPFGGPEPKYCVFSSPLLTSSPGMLTTNQWCHSPALGLVLLGASGSINICDRRWGRFLVNVETISISHDFSRHKLHPSNKTNSPFKLAKLTNPTLVEFTCLKSTGRIHLFEIDRLRTALPAESSSDTQAHIKLSVKQSRRRSRPLGFRECGWIFKSWSSDKMFTWPKTSVMVWNPQNVIVQMAIIHQEIYGFQSAYNSGIFVILIFSN